MKVKRTSEINRSSSGPDEVAGSDGKEAVQLHHIGAQIRELRKARGMTLENMSNSTKLSIGYLSQLERDLARPSVEAITKIASALNVESGMFYPQTVKIEEGSGSIVRASSRRVLKLGNGISDSLLCPGSAPMAQN